MYTLERGMQADHVIKFTLNKNIDEKRGRKKKTLRINDWQTFKG